MISNPTVDVLNLTDALLNVARSPNPDLVFVASLLIDRDAALARLPLSPSSSAERLAVLRRIQAADSELRWRFEERRALVEAELMSLNRRGVRRRPSPSQSHLVDRSA